MVGTGAFLPQAHEHAAEHRPGATGPAHAVDDHARARLEPVENAIHLPPHELELGRWIAGRPAELAPVKRGHWSVRGPGTAPLGRVLSNYMARISDTERVLRLLASEGGTLGKREIIENLGISEQRYKIVAGELVKSKLAVKNRGRAGGLALTAQSAPKPADAGSRVPDRPLERDLYPAFSKYLTVASGDESKSVVLETYRTKAGKWETPDLTEVRVQPFPIVGQWELRVVTYELKRQAGWSVESVLQTATYNEFAHESWLVIPAEDEADWTEYFGPRVVDKAGDFGIGLGSFDSDGTGTFHKHMTPQRKHVPSLARVESWLTRVIGQLGAEKQKSEIANNIRWAKAKAEAGKD